MKKETFNLETATKLVQGLAKTNSITIAIDSQTMGTLKEAAYTNLVGVAPATALKHLELYQDNANTTVTFLFVADMFDYATAYNAATDVPSETPKVEYTPEQEYEMQHAHYQNLQTPLTYDNAGRRYSHL
jgi:hypothetical protein